MNQFSSQIAAWRRTAPGLWWVNIAFGSLLWFFYCTDYSLPGTVSDILFPPIAALFGMVAFVRVGAVIQESRKKHWLRMACLPSLVGGLSFALICSVLLIPPFTLGGFFIADSLRSETLTQQVRSPNGLLIAEVYIRPGGYSGSYNKPIFVRLKSPFFPFIERDVQSISTHMERSEANNYIFWGGDNSLRISQTGEILGVGLIKPEVSLTLMIAAPLTACSILLSTLFGRRRYRRRYRIPHQGEVP